ncbi:MAG: hypothetical protein JRI79_13895 [Deltaproteobacteria bacterium]|nr:hypothetical protein [Deltaproteobacteria bacterium]MBW1979037.1 hypothetical protein [Deltaproteobacteria bacterium]MBW2043623.1 hypothetical protein [Deltaproteobacteria bacterium]MBW2299023.1 hypothetical protein [Deltaproteobacteria bacterium]RLB32869.1 MAG: hypothetical protein DRH11_10445 [Deltaproteobacteria bacterium]
MEVEKKCACGHSFSIDESEKGPIRCPKCGRLCSDSVIGQAPSEKRLSEAEIQATFEVMAEEGAIWSGAR